MVLGLIIAAFVFTFAKSGPVLKEAKTYIDLSIPAIATTWDGAELFSRAAPELVVELKDGALETLMADGSRLLGEMTSYAGAECSNYHFSATTQNGSLAQVTCTAHAIHQRAEADYSVTIIKRDEEWRVLKFHLKTIEGKHNLTDV